MITDKALLLLAALAPTAMSLIGIIFAKANLKEFMAEVRRQQEEMARKLDDVMAAGHRGAPEIMRQMTTLHEWVAVVEAKQGR